MGAKLVRDRIGNLEWQYPDAKASLRPVRDKGEHIRLLRNKVIEEFIEYLDAATGADVTMDVMGELADTQQALWDLILIEGFSVFGVEKMAREKGERVGTFINGMVWSLDDMHTVPTEPSPMSLKRLER